MLTGYLTAARCRKRVFPRLVMVAHLCYELWSAHGDVYNSCCFWPDFSNGHLFFLIVGDSERRWLFVLRLQPACFYIRNLFDPLCVRYFPAIGLGPIKSSFQVIIMRAGYAIDMTVSCSQKLQRETGLYWTRVHEKLFNVAFSIKINLSLNWSRDALSFGIPRSCGNARAL